MVKDGAQDVEGGRLNYGNDIKCKWLELSFMGDGHCPEFLWAGIIYDLSTHT